MLLVVLFHLHLGKAEAGYLGVDIFFVISGYLITSMIAAGMRAGKFSRVEFYQRRAKRLLPAAYVTILVTALAAPIFLGRQELHDLTLQISGAVSFTANIVLWRQTGYFEGAGDLKPLLHMWSLAVEEQFYFVLPLVMLWVRPSRWFGVALGGLLVSLGLYVVGMTLQPSAAFYLLPTRAWELLIGACIALWASADVGAERPLGTNLAMAVRWLFVPALFALVVVPFIVVPISRTWLTALVVCSATAIVILRRSKALSESLPARGLAQIGDISYSLYLVHWPIASFLNNAWSGGSEAPSLWVRLAMLLLSVGAAVLLYRYVENPIRHRTIRFTRELVAGSVAVSIVSCAIVPLSMAATPERYDFERMRRFNSGLSAHCDFGSEFTRRAECETTASPRFLIWGDSFAMHLVPGLERAWPKSGLLQATKSKCAPFVGIAPVETNGAGNYVREWAEECLTFNQSVLDYLERTPTIRVVVLSSALTAYTDEAHFAYLHKRGAALEEQPASATAVFESLQRTAQAIRRMGKSVVFVAPPPYSGFDIGLCIERELSGKLSYGRPSGCMVNRHEFERKRSHVLAFLDQVQLKTDVPVVRFEPWLCGSNACRTFVNDTMLYRDNGHLSYAGSELIASHMQLGQLIADIAR